MAQMKIEAEAITCNSVRFDGNVKVSIVLCREDYTEVELQDCFYTSDERNEMHSERKSIITRMEREQTIWQSEHKRKQKAPSSFRGLETSTRDGSIMSQNRVWEVVDNVLIEQEDQRQAKVSDSERIRTASRSASIQSTLLALRSAIADQEAAFKVYRNWAVDNPVVFAATTA